MFELELGCDVGNWLTMLDMQASSKFKIIKEIASPPARDG
jgi:hypothetical protein